ncbi:MAG: exopolysaccharide biosynthesis polyprenyl glycosylphosphotransferase [Lachnospiraceae bacterium]|nr:exopolysaccharide biosynthesis polyprenyl glycosylphosphotransferase [Lachnospiraceae bacterium]
MKRFGEFKRLIVLCFSLITIASESLVYCHFWYNRYSIEIRNNLWFTTKGHWLAIAIYVVLLFAFSTMYGGLNIGYLKASEVIFSQMFSIIATNVITYGQISLMNWGLMYPPTFIKMTIYQAAVSLSCSVFFYWLYRKIFPPRRLLLVHGDRPYDDLVRKFESRKDKYEISKCIDIREGLDRVCAEACERYDAVVIGDIDVGSRNKIFKFCYGKGIRTYILPKISDVILSGAEEMHIFDTPMFLTREYSLRIEEKFIKRLMDIALSLILLVLSSPFMLLTALAVKLYDGGPILYKQIRCTENMREFHILKFRSMRVDAEKDGVARLASKNDDRITPVGRVIRKCRLDELPQLINILKGDMSFVGPRPERPEIIRQYMEVMPEFVYRTKVKAGLAGYAQIYGKYNTTPYDKLKLDLTYIENYSVWLDLRLMLLTLKILFWPDSTEGVEAEQVTAFKEEVYRQKDADRSVHRDDEE